MTGPPPRDWWQRTVVRPPLRVVFNGRFLTQVPTGVQRYARESLRAFDRLLDEEPRLRAQLVCMLAVPRGAAPIELAHIRVRVLPLLSGHLWEQLALPWCARGDYLVNFNYSAPVVKRHQLITLHDASVAAIPHGYSWRYRLVHETLVRVLRHRVHTVMTVSRFSSGEIAQRYGVHHALVGMEGWEHSVAAGDGAATLRKYRLEANRYVLAVGSDKPHKNFEVLDRALALLNGFPFTVAIAGATDLAIFRHARPSQHTRLLGYVSDVELADLYRHAAWFVFPSTYEGFGLPALEAMGNGCPVIAARAASIPEVCGDAALYFDPHNAAALAALLERVAREPELRTSLRAKARARLARYSWADNARILARHLLRVPARP
ncbi:MAG TPA: glycosyltransferase family 1 protein [Burkholderiaceae bacterium]|nr:glycosyltransferase family 1 protein [Burkholderiaceae bacterium]